MPGAARQPPSELSNALGRARGAFAAVGFFSFVLNLLVLTVPLYMLQVYDRVLTSRNENTLLMLTVLAVGLLVAVGLFEFIRSRILVRIGVQLDEQLNTRLMETLLAARLRRPEAGTQALRDLETLRQFLTGPGLLALCDAPWTPLFIALIFLLHPLLGFVALGAACILFTLAFVGEMVTRKKLRDSAAQTMQAHEFAESSLRNAEAIAAMGMMPGLMRRWLERHETGLALQAEASDRSGTITALVKMFRPLAQVAILGCGALLAIEQIVTPGIMIAASIVMGRALAPVEAAIASWRNVVAARAARARIEEVLAEYPLRPESMSLPPPQGMVSVERVVAAPPGCEAPVLRGLSFKLYPGEIVGLVGPSAAGKSTLARLLVGVWCPGAGHVRLDGADVYDWNAVELGPHVGYLPQDVELFDGTVVDNICRFGDPESAKVVEAARSAGVHDMILRLPDGYDTVIGAGGGRLSGGQRQRIGLARALYGGPALVVLDEPNSNLDSEGEEALRRALLALKEKGATVVVIAHRPSVLTAVDKIMFLREGMIQAFGPAQEVLPQILQPAAASAPAAKLAPTAARAGATAAS
ncbi:MAG: type I secretion system permease/ATPase [Acetobacterales bacterium]